MINLLPPNRRVAIKMARNNTVLRRYLQLGILSAGILTAAYFATNHFFMVQKNSAEQQLKIDQERTAALAPVHEQAESLAATVNTIAGLMMYDIKFSDLLVQIGSIMPDGAVLTGLQFSVENIESPLVVTAEIDTEEKAAVLRNNLAASSLFDQAEIKSIVKKEETTESAPSGTQSALVPSLPLPQSPSGEPTAPIEPATPVSPYRFSTIINAYFTQEEIRGEGR